jgi:hypothetical protein
MAIRGEIVDILILMSSVLLETLVLYLRPLTSWDIAKMLCMKRPKGLALSTLTLKSPRKYAGGAISLFMDVTAAQLRTIVNRQ